MHISILPLGVALHPDFYGADFAEPDRELPTGEKHEVAEKKRGESIPRGYLLVPDLDGVQQTSAF